MGAILHLLRTDIEYGLCVVLENSRFKGNGFGWVMKAKS